MNFNRKKRITIISLIISLIIFLIIIYYFLFREREVFRVISNPKTNIRINIIYIDSETIKKLGNIPIGRKYFGDIISKLDLLGINNILFDIYFVPNDLSFTESDKYFLNQIKNCKSKIYFSYNLQENINDPLKSKKILNMDNTRLFSIESSKYLHDLTQTKKIFSFIPFEFIKASTGSALSHYINYVKKGGGRIFKNPILVYKMDAKVYPSIWLLVIRDFYNIPNGDVIVNGGQYVSLLKKGKIPIDAKGNMKVIFVPEAQRTNYYNEYSFIDVLNNKVNKDDFRDSIVIIGAKYTNDYFCVSPEREISGTFICAEIIRNMDIYLNLKGDNLKYVLDKKPYDFYVREKYYIK